MVLKDLQNSHENGGLFHGIFDLENRMIGVVDYLPSGLEGNPEQAFIELLMIAAPYRSKGIGTEIVQLVEDLICEDAAITEIRGTVQSNNPNAVRFWKRIDYEIISGPELQPDNTTIFHLSKSF
jgi:RimJ/RimL family protein N-acetyltransferase